MHSEHILRGIYRPGSHHWVGDGFHVHNLFPSNDLDRELSPFLLLDYAAPESFPPSDRAHGVGEHPHRGFETVTVVYQGELEHRDSSGSGGRIGPGDVQWMTAGGGLVHEEFHARDFAKRGGVVEMVQLWVNLPRAHKLTAPRYQSIVDRDIPSVALAGGGRARLISGSLNGVRGPASTFSAVNLFDLRLPGGTTVEIPVPQGHTAGVFVLHGALKLSDGRDLGESGLAVYGRDGDAIRLTAAGDTIALLFGGEPIDEPIARHGPFVMNTQEEIIHAIDDYRAGRMGHLPQTPI